MSNKYSTVYMPTKRLISDYLPYFRYEEDENIEDCGYLLKDVKIDIKDMKNTFLIVKNIVSMYNSSNSEGREALEKEGLKFEYVLQEDQTGSYYIVRNDAANEYISKAVLNIAVYEGEFECMVLVTADGMCYGHASFINMLDEEGKAFVKELVDKGLLRKKRVRIYEENIDLEDIVNVE